MVGRLGGLLYCFFLPYFLVAETRTKILGKITRATKANHVFRALGLHICAVRNTPGLNGTHLAILTALDVHFAEIDAKCLLLFYEFALITRLFPQLWLPIGFFFCYSATITLVFSCH